MSYESILVETRGAVGLITQNRPKALNAFNEPLHDAVHRVWDQIARDDDARAVVLTGSGKAFSAGGDIPWFQRNAGKPPADLTSPDVQSLPDSQIFDVIANGSAFSPSSRLARSASRRNSRSFPGSFLPGRDSTPLATSTA